MEAGAYPSTACLERPWVYIGSRSFGHRRTGATLALTAEGGDCRAATPVARPACNDVPERPCTTWSTHFSASALSACLYR